MLAAPFVAATALICSISIPGNLCVPSNALVVLHAKVPKTFCQQAMQQVVAAHTTAQPLSREEYVKITCGAVVSGGLTADDVGKVAPPSVHVWSHKQ